MIGQDDPEYATTADEAKRASLEVYMYANQLAAERRRQPGDDLISVLLNAEVDGEKLTEMEFDVFFVLLMVAGNETTRNLAPKDRRSGPALPAPGTVDGGVRRIVQPSALSSRGFGIEELQQLNQPPSAEAEIADREAFIWTMFAS